MREKIAIGCLSSLLFAMSTMGQAWSGILDPTRAIDWSGAGAGAIPARTTICAALGTAGQAPSFVQSVDVSSINSSLSSCSSGETVLLNPGTYNTVGGTITIPSNVTLRGSGPTQTILAQTSVPGDSTIPVIQFGTPTKPSSGTYTAITGGATQGSKQITVASASGISVGTLLMLTQTDLSYMTNVGSNGECTYCNNGFGGDSGQTVQVTAVNGTTLTISDPLYIAYTSSPQAYPFSVGATGAGLENLKISASNAEVINVSGVGYDPNINMSGTVYSWVKNVESDFAEGSHLYLTYAMHNTIRDSFFHDAFNHSPGSAEGDVRFQWKASANLVENNIFWRQFMSINMEWGASGNVIAYNYSTGNQYEASSWNFEDITHHGAHPMMNLYEGNISTHYQQDQTHGSSSHETIFRSYSTGVNKYISPDSARGTLNLTSGTVQATSNAAAFELSSVSQYGNLVGIIDGGDYLVNSQHAPSKQVYPTSTGSPACIEVGYNDDNSTGSSPNLTDSTMLYQGVMDCNTGTFQWQNGVQSLPASFYLSGMPSWWGSVAWPAIGPDVTAGDFTDWLNSTASTARGHVNKIPALSCFNSSTSNGTTNVTTFDANACYAAGASAPAPPTALTVVVK